LFWKTAALRARPLWTWLAVRRDAELDENARVLVSALIREVADGEDDDGLGIREQRPAERVDVRAARRDDANAAPATRRGRAWRL
jgi:hypothetical protein